MMTKEAKRKYDRERLKKYYRKNLRKERARRKKYRIENKETVKSSNQKWRAKNRERILWGGAKLRARRKKIIFNIEISDVVIPKVCPVLGIKLRRGKGCVSPTSPVIDRITPKLGYVKGNILVVSHRANSIKQNATPDEIIKVGKFYKNLI